MKIGKGSHIRTRGTGKGKLRRNPDKFDPMKYGWGISPDASQFNFYLRYREDNYNWGNITVRSLWEHSDIYLIHVDIMKNKKRTNYQLKTTGGLKGVMKVVKRLARKHNWGKKKTKPYPHPPQVADIYYVLPDSYHIKKSRYRLSKDGKELLEKLLSSAKTDHARMLLQGIKKDAEQNRLTWADILLMKSMVKS